MTSILWQLIAAALFTILLPGILLGPALIIGILRRQS